ELKQLQSRPFAESTFAPSEPLLSDGDIAPRSLNNQPPRKNQPVLSVAADHPNAGKSGAQLADDIEKARLRMIAARKAEESAKEFLVGRNTVVNAGIPRNTPTQVVKPMKGMSAAEKYPLVDEAPAPALSKESISFRETLLKE